MAMAISIDQADEVCFDLSTLLKTKKSFIVSVLDQAIVVQRPTSIYESMRFGTVAGKLALCQMMWVLMRIIARIWLTSNSRAQTQGVHGHLTKKPKEIGVGDQGHMFGYATNETDQKLMPFVHVMATKLGAMLTLVRKNGTCAWLPRWQNLSNC
ncbi:hypothetical protein L7F22_038330 [Adiantum nelumboides]|nr:hypothetical protein [Adiantum nelumboides]